MNLREWLVLVWMGMAFAGLVFSFFAIGDARADKRSVLTWTHRGTRLVIANANLRREYVRSIIYVTFFTLGVAAIFSPAPGTLHAFRIFFSLSLLFVETLTVFNSFQDLRDRRHLYEEIARQMAGTQRLD